MDRLHERIPTATAALRTLQEVVIDNPTDVVRDAAIQRFEYTVEAVWKSCQRYLNVVHGLTPGSPKGCVRGARDVGLLSDAEATAALKMIDDRDLTSHTYNEQLAIAIYAALGTHVKLLELWLGRMRADMERR